MRMRRKPIETNDPVTIGASDKEPKLSIRAYILSNLHCHLRLLGPKAASIIALAAQSTMLGNEFGIAEKLGEFWTLAARFALRARFLQRRRRISARRHVPDILRIFADGAVGGEPRHPRDIEDAGPRPCRNHLPAGVDAALGLVVGIEIRAHHVMVEMAQRVG